MDMLISLGVIMTFFLDKAIGSARCVADLVGSCGCMYIISFVCVCVYLPLVCRFESSTQSVVIHGDPIYTVSSLIQVLAVPLHIGKCKSPISDKQP